MRPPRRQNRGAALRSLALQLLALALLVGSVAAAGLMVSSNLARQGTASGFAFLSKTAGFDIVQHLIPYTEESSYGTAFVVALLNSLLVSALGIVLATLLGFALGVARLSRNLLVSKLALVYVETVRNIPLLLQLFFWYFVVLRALPSARESYQLGSLFFLNIRGLYVPAPQLTPEFRLLLGLAAAGAVAGLILWRILHRQEMQTGRRLWGGLAGASLAAAVLAAAILSLNQPLIWDVPELSGFNFNGGLVLLPELVALLLALSIYTAAFIAEIVRAGILAVPKGQTEAALALGLTRMQVLRLVVLPQAMRVILPPLTSQYLNLTKNSSLAAAIAYPDLVLVFAGTVLMQTGQAVEVIAMTMGVYLVISLVISLAMNRYNNHLGRTERTGGGQGAWMS